jgi:predicted phage-related endonuclease
MKETIYRHPVSVRTTEVIEREEFTELDPSMEEVILEFNALKLTIKALEANKARMDQKIREALKGSDVGTINGVERVRVQHRNMSKIDREMLKTAFPEAYQSTLIESAYTVLQAK